MNFYLKPGLVCGQITHDARGYRWMPFTSARRPSRKSWPTPEAALKGRIQGGMIAECRDFKHAQELANALADTGRLYPCPKHPHVLREHAEQCCPRCEAEIDGLVMHTINDPILLKAQPN